MCGLSGHQRLRGQGHLQMSYLIFATVNYCPLILLFPLGKTDVQEHDNNLNFGTLTTKNNILMSNLHIFAKGNQ